MSRIAFAIVIALAVAGGAAAAGALQTFYVVHVRDDASQVMVVAPAQVTTSADGHKIFPAYVIFANESVDTTVLEVDCAAKRRRVISESLLAGGDTDPIDKTSQNDLSWQGYGSDAPADQLACAAPGDQITATKYQAVDLKTFARACAATLRSLQESPGK